MFCYNKRIKDGYYKEIISGSDPYVPAALGMYLTFDPREVKNMFFRGSGLYTSDSTVQDTAWAGMTMAISTALSPATMYVNQNQTATLAMSGYTPAGGYTYKAPSRFNSNTNNLTGLTSPPTVSPIQTAVHYFGSPPKPSAGSYGFAVTDVSSQVAISDSYRGMFMQPNADSTFLRSATATTLPSQQIATSNYQAYSVSFTQPTPQTITFPKAYTNPPLIFVTETTGDGGVALNYMIRDAAGKYVGASIVCDGVMGYGSYASYGIGAYGSKSINFKYFLLSDEFPDYMVNPYHQDACGIRVYNASGGKVFDSEYFVPSLIKGNAQTPYAKASGSYTYTSYYSSFTTYGRYTGLCINNINPITGYTYIIQNALDYSGLVYAAGTFTMTGQFASVKGSFVQDTYYPQTQNRQTSLKIEGGFACSMTHSSAIGTHIYNWLGDTAQSYHFACEPNANTNYLMATWAHQYG